ncbi:MAG: hypothetical protein ACM359_23055, partial [Bacillota bacterium]
MKDIVRTLMAVQLTLGLLAMVGCQSRSGSTSSADAGEGVRASVQVVELRCEYLGDPLGIDVRRPRLSWQLAATDPAARGQRQTAYRVLVS